MPENPLVSIVIRTCARPAWAMEALQSAMAQTYDPIEIILLEDGPPLCEPYLENLGYTDRVVYEAFGKNRGRSIAGNEALNLARGTYINFLDDDDLLYANHVESLVPTVQRRDGIAYAGWEVVRTECISLDPLKTREHKSREQQLIPFNKISLWVSNYIPIQAVMFHRRFYEQLGGFDQTLQAFEDWELWCRYSTKAEFDFVPKITSVFRIPYEAQRKKTRDSAYEARWSDARKKIEALPFEIDGFTTDTFVKFAEHYAARNKLIKVGRQTQKILSYFGIGKRYKSTNVAN